MSSLDRQDRDRLSSDYEVLLGDGHRQRWSLANEGNRLALVERLRVTERLAAGLLSAPPRLVLDLGCGDLSQLPTSLQACTRVGLDILDERLRATRERHPGPVLLVNADGARLPFADQTFDAVVLATMMSSVRDDRTRASIAAEARRVLVDGGMVVWFDFRYPSPGNRAVRPVSRRALRRLFSGMPGTIASTTLLPPVARRLGRSTRWSYPLLARLPFLRSHLVGCLVKAAE